MPTVKQVNSVQELIEEIQNLMGGDETPTENFAPGQLSEAIHNLGFRPRVYFDGVFVAQSTEPQELIENQAPITILWTRDDGQQCIQCAKADGTTEMFWPIASGDIQSQLASLSERFAKPSILGGDPTKIGLAAGAGGTTAG